MHESINGSNPEFIRKSPVYVLKFGGSSLGNARSIDKEVVGFVNYCRKDGRQVVIVASAMKGVTEKLSNACDLISHIPSEADRFIKDVRTQHTNVIKELTVSPLARLEIGEEFDSLYNGLVRFLSCVQTATPSIRDEILSYGERFNAPIVAGVLRNHFIDAQPVDSRNVIVTDNQFGEAAILVENTRTDGIMSLVQKGIIPVVTGFIGATKDGQTTTLGPNSSDVTAAVLAERLKAKELWICKDVEGLYDAHGDVIPKVGFNEIFSVKGSTQVVHPLAVMLSNDAHIPIRVKCTANPQVEGTLIFDSSQLQTQHV